MSKISANIELQYIENSNLSENDYLNFLKVQYGDRAIFKCGARRDWYKQKSGYIILLAIADNKILGQSCAFKDTIIIQGKETDIWWGIDVFVLPEARGNGIGKLMQKKLHKDLPNFSSAWYSPINGIVKKKCGSKELFPLSFCYYPVSSFISYLGMIVVQKMLKRDLSLKISIPFLYSTLNRSNKYKNYSYRKIGLTENVFEFINTSSLSFSDFYVKRDKHYLKWRYTDNPNLKYHVIEIIKNELTECIVLFTDVYIYGNFYVSKIMDVFKDQSSLLKDRDIIYFVSKYFHDNKHKLDGILSLTECCYFPKFVRRSIFLSTIETETKINNPYISYSDQDMVQMY